MSRRITAAAMLFVFFRCRTPASRARRARCATTCWWTRTASPRTASSCSRTGSATCTVGPPAPSLSPRPRTTPTWLPSAGACCWTWRTSPGDSPTPKYQTNKTNKTKYYVGRSIPSA
eukprot:8683439-Pyramimonas_sp.AAC.1